MAETQAMIGYGTKFYLENDASPPTLEELAEIVNVTPPNDSIAMLDATHMQSPNRTMEFVPGLTDPGSAGFVMNFIPGSNADVALQAWRTSGARKQCRIVFPNGVTWTFSGLLESYQPEAAVADVMRATVGIKVTGSTVPGTSP